MQIRGGANLIGSAPQMEYERQVATMKAAAAGDDFSVSQAELSSRQAMLENASDIKVTLSGRKRPFLGKKNPFYRVKIPPRLGLKSPRGGFTPRGFFGFKQ